MTAPRSIAVFTHEYPQDTRDGVARLVDAAMERGVQVCMSSREAEKLALDQREQCVLDENPAGPADLAVVFGGDGTILSALRAAAASRAPVFAFNYGAIGFLSTVERDQLDEGVERVLDGRFDVLPMPALEVEIEGERRIGVNDISFQRRASNRVARLEYSVGAEQLGIVRCDGLVAATPVGSTGYNLANGGPVLAWGVEGFVVSFIAPHTLTARALVVAPDDTLTVTNVSERDAVDITTDGRPVGELGCGERLELCFRDDQVLLAQTDGATFYHRFREKFGRLAY
ncbi:MAG TPA: NAD(+)/NADH kinase [Thermoleophilaceae bacterium]|nr:NAD(+)/NADH kinase [Thermoleophilaceae bacterium]